MIIAHNCLGWYNCMYVDVMVVFYIKVFKLIFVLVLINHLLIIDDFESEERPPGEAVSSCICPVVIEPEIDIEVSFFFITIRLKMLYLKYVLYV